MPDDPGADRRQHERFELLVDVAVGRETETLTVINISAGGVLLRNDRNAVFQVGELIRVQFDVPQLAAKFQIEAKIIRVVAKGSKSAALAAMWTSSDPAATEGLAQLLWGLSSRRSQ